MRAGKAGEVLVQAGSRPHHTYRHFEQPAATVEQITHSDRTGRNHNARFASHNRPLEEKSG